VLKLENILEREKVHPKYKIDFDMCDGALSEERARYNR